MELKVSFRRIYIELSSEEYLGPPSEVSIKWTGIRSGKAG